MKKFSLIFSVLALITIGYGLPTLLSNHLPHTPSPSHFDCEVIEGYCEVNGVSLSLAHTQSLLANQITVEIPELSTDSLDLTLKGVEMDMGDYTLVLNHLNDSTYQADLWFPVCMHDTMTWAGTLSDPNSDFAMTVAIEVHR